MKKIFLILCLCLLIGCSVKSDCIRIDFECKPTMSFGAGPAFTPEGKLDPWSLTPGIKCIF